MDKKTVLKIVIPVVAAAVIVIGAAVGVLFLDGHRDGRQIGGGGRGDGQDAGYFQTAMTAVGNALAASDYQAWADLIKTSPGGEKLLEVINKDNFAKYVEAYNLTQQSKKILEDLGVENAMLCGGNFGMQYGKGFDGNGVGMRNLKQTSPVNGAGVRSNVSADKNTDDAVSIPVAPATK